jgi:iron complex outermembrane receptor protein
MRKAMRHALLCGTATVLTICAVPAFAQDAAAPADSGATQGDASDIVVTARRIEERLQDVPISITVFNQAQLTSRNINNGSDLAIYTPSLSANSNFGSENTTFAIRGFTQEIGTAPSVGVYFADVVTPRGASNGLPTGDGLVPGMLFDLQNVQVLKGPQGTLFGRNTTGGAVLVVPQKPTHELEGYVEGSYGNFNMWRVQGVLNIPLSETFRVRLGVDHQSRDGYLNNNNGSGPKRLGDVDYTGVRLSIVGDLTPDLENYTIATYNKSDNTGSVQKLVAANPSGLGNLALGQLTPGQPNYQGAGFYDVGQGYTNNPYSKLEQWQVINTTTWKASDNLTVKNIVSYSQFKQDLNTAIFGTNFFVGPYGTPFTGTTPPPNLHTANESTFTEELQFQGTSSDDRLTWQAGGYFELARPLGLTGSQSPFLASCINSATFQCTDPLGTAATGQILQALFNPLTPPATAAFLATQIPQHVGTVNYTVGRTSYRDVGAYAQATYKFTDQIKLTGGFRYTWDREENTSLQQVNVLRFADFGTPFPFPTGYGLYPTPVPPGTNGNQTTNPRCTKPDTAPTCVSEYRQSTSAPTWLIDLDWTPSPDLLIYAKYARGYRAGTIAPNVSSPFNYVRPEKVDTYEIGLKTSFNGGIRGTFNIAAFYNDFSNQQLQLGFNAKPGSGQASTAAPVNVNKSEIYGFELDGTLSPFNGLDLFYSYAYTRSRIKSVPDFSGFNDPNFTLSAPFLVGDEEVLTPRNKFTVGANYTLPLDQSVGRVSVGVTYSHADGAITNYADRASPIAAIRAFSYVPATDIVNLSANWNSIGGSPIDVSAFVTNLTNQEYYTYIPGLAAPGGTDFETAALGQPRMYGVRVRYSFGRR